MTKTLAERLLDELPGRAETGRRLAPLTTYRLGGPAAIYVEPSGEEDLRLVARVLAEADPVPILLLGRGSNLVISDEGWPGVVIRLAGAFSHLIRDGQGLVRAGAGVPLPGLANWVARRSLTGMEWAVGVPGAVGGGVRMNAGAHGREMADGLVAARVMDLSSGEVSERTGEDLGLSYRHSALQDGEVVVEAILSLDEADPAEVKGLMTDHRRHRSETQPGAAQNAGSVFKNPSGDSAGRLVERAGLKGFRRGRVRVSEVHANFFIAEDGATSSDVWALVGFVAARVEEETGVRLEPEIRFAGSFPADT